jgi:hypothetical protein
MFFCIWLRLFIAEAPQLDDLRLVCETASRSAGETSWMAPRIWSHLCVTCHVMPCQRRDVTVDAKSPTWNWRMDRLGDSTILHRWPNEDVNQNICAESNSMPRNTTQSITNLKLLSVNSGFQHCLVQQSETPTADINRPLSDGFTLTSAS